jgi:outer membrane protein assembly factor BamB
MFKVSSGELTGFTRGRILPALPFSEDFESFDVKVPHKQESGVTFAYPPLPWIGARFKWEIRERDGSKVLAKTLDRLLFQRAMTFIGHPHANNYTMTADLMTDGNRRIMSTVGVVNQRYIVALKGNWQVLEVSSNHDRLKVSVPFKWKPNIWYTLKTRVDIAADGSGVVRAKAWPRDSVEPDTWTIEVPHVTAHTRGAPGLFGFSPQSQKRVYVDNISVKSN